MCKLEKYIFFSFSSWYIMTSILFLISNLSLCCYCFNPLVPEFLFSSFFGTQPKIGSFRLPTHRRDAHRIFFLVIPSSFRIEILAIRTLSCTLGTKGLNSSNSLNYCGPTPAIGALPYLFNKMLPSGTYHRQQNKWYPQRCQIVTKTVVNCSTL